MVTRNDTYRMCVDYGDLNKVTEKDAYRLPNLDSALDKLRRAKYLSKIDLSKAFLQVPLEDDSKPYTAFALPGLGLLQFTRLPFGVTDGPKTFQRLMDKIITPDLEPFVLSYQDDIIIATEDFQEHLKYLKIVFKKLIDAGLSINPDKCDFGCCVVYLGFILDANGLRPDKEKIRPGLEYPAPTNVKELRRFLGMVGWYSRFINNVAELKIPLVKLLHKDIKWSWGAEQTEAFEKLKLALVSTPVLARPDFSLPFTVQTDASNMAIGAVLTQMHEDGEHPVVYISRVLTAQEQNYSATERECLTLLWAIKRLRPYLEGYKFTAITDHSSLKWLSNLKETTGRLARWALELQQWDFDVVYRKGSLNLVPDALSRIFYNLSFKIYHFLYYYHFSFK